MIVEFIVHLFLTFLQSFFSHFVKHNVYLLKLHFFIQWKWLSAPNILSKNIGLKQREKP